MGLFTRVFSGITGTTVDDRLLGRFLRRAHDAGLAGATVWRGLEGYGHSSRIHTSRLLSLAEMREMPALAGMRLLQRGNRLSITPVTAAEWRAVTAALDAA